LWYSNSSTLQHTANMEYLVGCIAVAFRVSILDRWRTATLCITLQLTATLCTTLQHTAPHCNTMPYTATHYNTPQRPATHCQALYCSVPMGFLGASESHFVCAFLDDAPLQLTATHCNTLRCAAKYCNTLLHIATQGTHWVLVRNGVVFRVCFV